MLAYDGSSMKQVDAAGIPDMAMSGTTATLKEPRLLFLFAGRTELYVDVDCDASAEHA